MNVELLKICVDLLEKSDFCEKHKKDFEISVKTENSDEALKLSEADSEKLRDFCFDKLKSLYRELETQLYNGKQ